MSLAAEPETTDARAGRFRRRYGRSAPLPHGPWSDTLDVLLDHKTTRAYLRQPVPAGVVETLVAAAQSAPTSSNLQAWSVVAVQDPARKARLAQLASSNPHIEEAPLFLIWVADLARARAIASSSGTPGDGLDYLESFLVAAIDAALAAQNAVVAIDSLGLGSCYIGGMRNHPEAVAQELGLPPEAVAVFGLTVGYPDPARASDVKPRLPQSSVLHYEQYGEPVRPADLDAYNATLKLFRSERARALADGTERVARRVGTPPALKGRERLTQILRKLGFKLI